jgi:hypothetical protein
VDLSDSPIALVLALLLLPAVIAGVGLLLASRRGDRGSAGRLGALAVGLGYVAGHRATLGRWPLWPPASSKEALLYAGAIAALAGMLAGGAMRPATRLAVLAAAQLGAAWLVLRNQVESMALGEAAAIAALVVLVPPAVAGAFERFAEREPGLVAPLALWMVATATAAASALTGSILFAQFGASLAAVIGAAVVLGVLSKSARFSGGALLAANAQIATLVLAAHRLSELPLLPALLLAIAPLGACVAPKSKRNLSLALALTALPLAVALALCWIDHSRRAGPH